MLKRRIFSIGITGVLAMGAAATARAQVASLVKDVQPGANSSFPGGAVELNGALLLLMDDGTAGVEPWRTDGTAAGTTLLKDIRPGPASGAFSPQQLIVSGNIAFFSADDGTTGFELWKTDGTAAGTTLVKDIRPGAIGSFPILGAVLGGALYFYASDGTNGIELWKSDGTSAGTTLVKDIRPGSSSGPQGPLTVAGSTLYFPAYDDGTNGIELWKSDGTASGTVLVKDLNPGSGDSNPTSLTAVGNAVFFVADDGASGIELWKSDGTPAGTTLVKDVLTGSGSGASGSALAAFGNILLFTATDGSSGVELWRSDGTAAGTSRVMDIWPGGQGSDPINLTAAGAGVFFLADDGSHGLELWKSDGTAGGTALVKDIQPGAGSGGTTEGFLTAFGGKVLFPADDGSHGLELWKSDGSASGTLMVEDLRPGAAGSSPQWVVALGSTFVSVQDDGAAGAEPWLLPAWALDTTPPAVTPTVAGTLGGGGFYTSDVTVTWSSVDGDSPILRTTGCSPATVSADTAGMTVQCTAVSGGGTTTGSVTVKRDTAPPAVTCPANVTTFSSSSGGRNVNLPPATATDAIDPAPTVALSPASGSLFATGVTHVTATATDAAGLGSSCVFDVTVVVDQTPPVVVCPADVTVEDAAPGGATVSYAAATATDDHDPAPALSYSTPSGASFPVGETTVDVTARDVAGNAATCAFKVIVNARAGGCGCGAGTARGSPAWSFALLAFALLRVARGRARAVPARTAAPAGTST